jgi:hypothetical protein
LAWMAGAGRLVGDSVLGPPRRDVLVVELLWEYLRILRNAPNG